MNSPYVSASELARLSALFLPPNHGFFSFFLSSSSSSSSSSLDFPPSLSFLQKAQQQRNSLREGRVEVEMWYKLVWGLCWHLKDCLRFLEWNILYRYIMLYYVMSCYIMLYYVVLCCVQCSLCRVVLCCVQLFMLWCETWFPHTKICKKRYFRSVRYFRLCDKSDCNSHLKQN